MTIGFCGFTDWNPSYRAIRRDGRFQLGWHVALNDGARALEKFDAHPVDVVVVRQGLPSGEKVLARLSQKPNGPRIIIAEEPEEDVFALLDPQ